MFEIEFTTGVGFTVNVNDVVDPKQVPNTGVTLNTALIAVVSPVTIKGSILPVPIPGKPITTLEFVHSYDAPGVPEK